MKWQVILVSALASAAHGGLSISVDGVINPPDSSIALIPHDTVVIGVHGDQTALAMLLVQGAGLIDASNPTFLWEQSEVRGWPDSPIFLPPDMKRLLCDLGYCGVVELLEVDVVDRSEPYTVPDGLVIDGLIFEGTGIGDAVLTLTDLDLNVFDVQTIHIPEPMTIGLLGLGGLVVLRKRR